MQPGVSALEWLLLRSQSNLTPSFSVGEPRAQKREGILPKVAKRTTSRAPGLETH